MAFSTTPQQATTTGVDSSKLQENLEKASQSPIDTSLLNSNFNYDTAVQEPLGQFGRYSIAVLLIVQCGMVAIAGVILSPGYHKTSPLWTCNSNVKVLLVNVSNGNLLLTPTTTVKVESSLDNKCDCPAENRSYANKNGFYTFAREFGIFCERKKKGYYLGTYLMVGGLVGAICFGQVADIFGRKYSGMAALAGAMLLSFIFMFVKSYTVACIVMGIMGFFGGGYMVVGVVVVIEFVGRDWRLFVSCFHGWPYGLMYMSLIGFITKNWRYYHLAMSITGIPPLLGWCFMVESPRWLIRMNKLKQAGKSIAAIAKSNGGKSVTASKETLERLYQVESVNREKLKGFTYFDLFFYPTVMKLVLSLAFVWFASGLISWGIYFNLGSLSGNIYLNYFLTGLFKALAGSILPMGFNLFLGRRPIILSGIIVSCACMWGIVGIFIHQGVKGGVLGKVVTGLAIVSVAAMDPTWKINHLYSSELFPTVVRNMSNGICNMGSRIASIIAPLVASLEDDYLAAPFIILAILGVFQFLVAFFFLPETKGKPLPDSLPPKEFGRGAKVFGSPSREPRGVSGGEDNNLQSVPMGSFNEKSTHF